jgi:aryl-alcohol dehydrogenase-like predicted oxidoreductase
MKLALGTVQFGLNYGVANRQGQVSQDEAQAILEHAWASGMDTLDTAIDYGDSEQRLGEIGIQNWRVVSKLPAIPEGCSDVATWVINSVTESLQRLKVKCLYGLLLHQPQQLLAQDGGRLYSALQHLKRDGLVGKIGISIYDPAELDTICGQYHLDIVQAPFNVLDRRLIESGWLARLAEQDTELHVRSVFLQGLLLMKAAERPDKFNRWQALWERWDAGLAESNSRPLEVCLAYALSFPEISRVIVGVDSSEQLLEILSVSMAGPIELPYALWTTDINLLNPSRWPRL